MNVVFIFNKPNRRRLHMCTATMIPTITIMINVAAATTSCVFPFLKRRTHKYSSIRVALNQIKQTIKMTCIDHFCST